MMLDSVKTLTVEVPIAHARRRGRKRIVAPDGSEMTTPAPAPSIDSALIKAIARAYRWQRLLESGMYSTLKELAAAERLDPAYVSRVLKLTLLAPSLVENALNGHQTSGLDLQKLARPIPVDWEEQARIFR